MRLQGRLTGGKKAAQVTRKPGALVHVENMFLEGILVRGLEGALDLGTHVTLNFVVFLLVLLQAVECCGVVRAVITRIFSFHSAPGRVQYIQIGCRVSRLEIDV